MSEVSKLSGMGEARGNSGNFRESDSGNTENFRIDGKSNTSGNTGNSNNSESIGTGENSSENSKTTSKPYYEQAGVAMTCRSYAEYERMFAIGREDFGAGPVLDVAAGASSFAAEAAQAGIPAIAADPMYGMAADEIERKGKEEIDVSTAKLARLQDHFDWSYYENIDRHRANRERSLQKFIADYRTYGNERYVEAALPHLPFEDDRFALVLCSHFLFLYGDRFDPDFHRQAVRELLRVCRPGGKLLIYPLKTLKFELYPGLPDIVAELQADGHETSYVLSHLPFIPGSTELLSIRKQRENVNNS